MLFGSESRRQGSELGEGFPKKGLFVEDIRSDAMATMCLCQGVNGFAGVFVIACVRGTSGFFWSVVRFVAIKRRQGGVTIVVHNDSIS